jgi:hypothetical protein
MVFEEVLSCLGFSFVGVAVDTGCGVFGLMADVVTVGEGLRAVCRATAGLSSQGEVEGVIAGERSEVRVRFDWSSRPRAICFRPARWPVSSLASVDGLAFDV